MIRAARSGDRPAIARLQAESWRDAYAGHLPQAFLGPALDERIGARWAAPPGPEELVLVAGGDPPEGFPDGFVAVLTGGEMPYVDNLHVRPGRRGSGIGAALMREAARALLARGHRAAYLMVMDANAGAIRFYRRLGGVIDPPAEVDFHGLPVSARRVAFTELAGLARGST